MGKQRASGGGRVTPRRSTALPELDLLTPRHQEMIADFRTVADGLRVPPPGMTSGEFFDFAIPKVESIHTHTQARLISERKRLGDRPTDPDSLTAHVEHATARALIIDAGLQTYRTMAATALAWERVKENGGSSVTVKKMERLGNSTVTYMGDRAALGFVAVGELLRSAYGFMGDGKSLWGMLREKSPDNTPLLTQPEARMFDELINALLNGRFNPRVDTAVKPNGTRLLNQLRARRDRKDLMAEVSAMAQEKTAVDPEAVLDAMVLRNATPGTVITKPDTKDKANFRPNDPPRISDDIWEVASEQAHAHPIELSEVDHAIDAVLRRHSQDIFLTEDGRHFVAKIAVKAKRAVVNATKTDPTVLADPRAQSVMYLNTHLGGLDMGRQTLLFQDEVRKAIRDIRRVQTTS